MSFFFFDLKEKFIDKVTKFYLVRKDIKTWIFSNIHIAWKKSLCFQRRICIGKM